MSMTARPTSRPDHRRAAAPLRRARARATPRTPRPTASSRPSAPTDYRAGAAPARRRAGVVGGGAPLSLYVHIPFCESVCYYCACNKVITRHHEPRPPSTWTRWSARSSCTSPQLGARPAGVAAAPGRRHAHLPDRRRADAPDGRAAPRLPPRAGRRDVDRGRPAHRRRRAPARTWPRSASTASASACRTSTPTCSRRCTACSRCESVRDADGRRRARCGFESINVDLIYGLPQQTPESFARTVAQVAELRPDRIALYAYAHLPQRFKPQRRIDAADAAAGRRHACTCCRSAIAGFLGHGYVVHRHGPLRAARRRAGRGQAPGPAAPQLPGLQHAARLRPDRPGRLGHRPHRRHLQPERQDAARVLRRAGAGRSSRSCAAWR